MYWIIQENLWNEEGYGLLLQALERSNSEYSIVKVRPFIHTIQPDLNPPNPVMVMGSTTLVQIGKERKWFPNAFINRNFDFSVQYQHWGGYMLNHDAIIGPVGTVEPVFEYFFIRPPEDSKLFTGEVMSIGDFEKWREQIAYVASDGYTTMTPDTPVLVAPVKNILQEFRLFIIDRKFITGSEYKRGGRPYQNAFVDPDVIEFGEYISSLWVPDFAFCLDIARTDRGLAIVEVNCINSSGFYKADVSKMIQYMERLYS